MPINHEQPPRYEDLDTNEPEHWQESDREENDQSRPPEGEEILRPVLMVADCFVGGDIEGLLAGCRALGVPDEDLLGRMPVYTWARQVRQTSRGGSWVEVAALHPADRTRRWMYDLPAQIPGDFQRIILKAFSPTPSVVFLVATFVLTEEGARGLDDELRTDRFLRVERRERSTVYISAGNRKLEALQVERDRVRAAACAWMAQTFAGTCSKDFGVTELPGIEFITTRVHEPFHEMERNAEALPSWHDYRFMMSFDSDSEAWASPNVRGWRIGLPWRPMDAEWMLVAGCRDAAVTAGDDGGDDLSRGGDDPGPRPRVTDTRRLSQHFEGLLLRFAAVHLAAQYEKALAKVRDDLATSSTDSDRAVKQIEAAQETLATILFDAPLVVAELRSWSSDDRRWRRDCIEPTSASKWKLDHVPDYPDLLSVFQENIEAKAAWVTGLEPRARDQLLARSSMLAASADLRLQRIVFAISVVALVVASIGLFVT